MVDLRMRKQFLLHLQYLLFGKFYQVYASQGGSQIKLQEFNEVQEVLGIQDLKGFSRTLNNNGHQFFIISFFILKVFHEFKVLRKQIQIEIKTVHVAFQHILGQLKVLYILDDELRIVYQDIRHQLFIFFEYLQGLFKDRFGIFILLLSDLKLDPSFIDLISIVKSDDFLIHFSGGSRIFSFFQITPVKIDIQVKFDKEKLIISQNTQDLGVLIGLILHVMKEFFPKLKIVSLSHQESFIAIRNIFYDPILPLQQIQLSPQSLLVVILRTSVEVVVLYLLLQLQSTISISNSLVVYYINQLFQVAFLELKGLGSGEVFILFYSQGTYLLLSALLEPGRKFLVKFLQAKQSSRKYFFEELKSYVFSDHSIILFIQNACSRICSNFNDSLLKFFSIFQCIFFQEFQVVQVRNPQIKAFRISHESSLVFLKFSQFNILDPIFIIERERFQKISKRYQIIIGLARNFQIFLPLPILFSI